MASALPPAQIAAQNLEDAANLAQEFIYSIDNLPQEVAFLLEEIRSKDVRCTEILSEIESSQQRYIRHSIRVASVPQTPTSTPSLNGRAMSPKSAAIPARVKSLYEEQRTLCDDKVALAERLERILQSTHTRLGIELGKVRLLQGEPKDGPLPTLSVNMSSGALADSLRPSIGASERRDRDHKRRRVESTPVLPTLKSAIGVSRDSSPRPPLVSAATSAGLAPLPQKRSHLPRSTTTQNTSYKIDDDEELTTPEDIMMNGGDGDDGGDGGDDDDDRPYCFCQKRSYGDMIACDNEGDCKYEWFHLACVALKPPLPPKWYCPDCVARGAGQPAPRPATQRERDRKRRR